MSYLFYVDEYDNKILRPECLKLCEELRVLSHQEVAAIVYAYDYHSIFKQYPEQDRKRKALIKVFGSSDKDIFENLKIKAGVEAYMSLQYNPKIELVATYQESISSLSQELRKAKDEKEFSRITKSIETCRKYLRELDSEVYDDAVKEGVVMGGASLSYLEIIQKNKVLYDTITKAK
jgi:hypothetical protein